jgi:ADP-heptose:LPS heptosyltransferase
MRDPGNGRGDVHRTLLAVTVLALRALGLGDALTGVPALRGLRRAFPDHRLVLAARPEIGLWLRNLGVVDDVLPAEPLAALPPIPDVSPGTELIAVNLHGRGPQSHRRLHELHPDRLIAFQHEEAGPDDGPVWRANEHEVDRWCRLVTTAGGLCGRLDLRLAMPRPQPVPAGSAPYVVVHPGAAAPGRRWPLNRWRAVVKNLLASGETVVITGGPDEKPLCARLSAGLTGIQDTSGQLGLEQLARQVAGARLLLCADTGVAHLATAFGTPSVVLFGPTPPSLWGPAIDPDRHLVLWPARPDDRRGDAHAVATDAVLGRITVSQVLEAVSRLSSAPFAAPSPASS